MFLCSARNVRIYANVCVVYSIDCANDSGDNVTSQICLYVDVKVYVVCVISLSVTLYLSLWIFSFSFRLSLEIFDYGLSRYRSSQCHFSVEYLLKFMNRNPTWLFPQFRKKKSLYFDLPLKCYKNQGTLILKLMTKVILFTSIRRSRQSQTLNRIE